jgi:hypothetical protein
MFSEWMKSRICLPPCEGFRLVTTLDLSRGKVE